MTKEQRLSDIMQTALEAYIVAHQGNTPISNVFQRKSVFPYTVKPGLLIEFDGKLYELVPQFHPYVGTLTANGIFIQQPQPQQ
jgi:hypothetical protein